MLRTLFETAGDSIFLLRFEGEELRFLDCNPRAPEMFGLPREEIIGRSPADPLLSPHIQPGGSTSAELAATVVRAALEGTPQQFAWDHYRGDGSLFHCEVTLNRLVVGDTLYVQAITRDITDRVAAEKTRAASDEKYRTLFEAAGDAIFVMDLTDEGPIFIDCNSVACEFFGRQRGELIGMSPADTSLSPMFQTDGTPSAQVAESMVTAALAGTPQRFEWDHIRSDGTPFITEVTLNRLDLGDHVYVQAITRDITARKQSQAFERLMRNELDHRVRNNMSTIQSLIAMTGSASATKDELQGKLTGRIHALTAVQDQLAARNWRGVGMHKLAEDTLAILAPEELRRLSTHGPDLALPASVAGPIAMCLNEFASNAIRHGALCATEGTIEVYWERRGETVELHWQEHGLHRAVMPEIREGRGLALVRGFVEHQLGGVFKCHPQPHGLLHTIEVPLRESTYITERHPDSPDADRCRQR
ncbi:MAG: PAS domain S-box protein [Planctomycetota bacterium]